MMKPHAWAAMIAFGALAHAGPASPARPAGSGTAAPGTMQVTHGKTGLADRQSRKKALFERYERNARKLDSLARADSAHATTAGGTRSRLLATARTRRDHTQYAINLLGFVDTTDPTAWEVAHARALDSLDSLEKSLKDVERERLQPEPPTPPPSASPRAKGR